MKKLILLFLLAIVTGCSTNSDSNRTNTEGPAVTDIDGNEYQSVVIGSQIWFKQNLNVSKYSDGTPIPQVTDPTEWDNLTTGAWCYYNNDPANEPIYGKLYNWYAVAGIYDEDSAIDTTLRKKLAPAGWHIPSNNECSCESDWSQLIAFLGGNLIAGKKLKEEGNLHWQNNNAATNSSGFTALPGGYRGNFGTFEDSSVVAGFWTSSQSDFSSAWSIIMQNQLDIIETIGSASKTGYTVRCVKDK